MKKHFLWILLLSLSSCMNGVDLPRVQGKTGPNAPVVTEDGVIFRIDAAQANYVTIAGGFNGWNEMTTVLEKNENGIWEIELNLSSGKKHQYKFIVDGQWIADPENPETTPDGFGGVNSVLDLREAK